MQDGFVILAEFTLVADQADAFLALVRRNAAASVREEPGCRRFDVLVPEDAEPRVVLYEIYDSPAAFEAHLASAHFIAFRDATAAMIAGRSVRRFGLDEHTKHGERGQ